MAEFESLDAIAQSDALLDAIAGARRFSASAPDEQALVSLLEGWRDGVRRHPVDEVVTEHEAAAALRKGVASERPAPQSPPRGWRGLSVIAAAAAAVLCIGGFGAVVAGSEPGDSLYGFRTVLFGEKPVMRDDGVALVAKTEMAQVQQMIEQGNWEQAAQKLQAVSTQVQSVDDVTTKTDLIQQWNDLSVKVGTRDATATLPPITPGALVAPPPAGVTLLELPVVEATTTAGESTSTTTTSGETTTSSGETTTSSGETTTSSGETTTSSGETTTSSGETTTSSGETTTSSTGETATSAVTTTTAPATLSGTTTAATSVAAPAPTTQEPAASPPAEQTASLPAEQTSEQTASLPAEQTAEQPAQTTATTPQRSEVATSTASVPDVQEPVSDGPG